MYSLQFSLNYLLITDFIKVLNTISAGTVYIKCQGLGCRYVRSAQEGPSSSVHTGLPLRYPAFPLETVYYLEARVYIVPIFHLFIHPSIQ